jgi:hypothetical protein
VEFLESVDNALIYVVEEETVNGTPDDVRHRVGHLDHLHKIGSDRRVEPRDYRLIDLQPFDVLPHVLHIHGAIDMVEQAELVERCIKQDRLGEEGGVVVIQGDRHVGVDVDVPDHGNSSDRGSISKGVLGGGNQRRRVGHHGRV